MTFAGCLNPTFINMMVVPHFTTRVFELLPMLTALRANSLLLFFVACLIGAFCWRHLASKHFDSSGWAQDSGCIAESRSPAAVVQPENDNLAKSGWYLIKNGKLANVFVEDVSYKSKYASSDLLHIKIKNQTSLPLILSSDLLFSSVDANYAARNRQGNILLPMNHKQLPSIVVSIPPAQSFAYYVPTRLDTNGVTVITGYCSVRNGRDQELFSAFFDDGKIFQPPKVKIVSEGRAARNLGAEPILIDRKLCYAHEFRRQIIRNDLEFKISHWGQCLDANPTDCLSHYWRAEDNFALGKYQDAMDDIEQAAKLKLAPSCAHTFKGRVYNATGKYHEALSEFGRGSGGMFSAYSYFKLREYDKALKCCSPSGKDDKQSFLLRGQIHEALGNYQKAAADFTAALYNDGDNDGELIRYFEDCSWRDVTQELHILHNAETFYRRADVYNKLGKTALASADMEQALNSGFLPGMDSCLSLASATP